MVSETNPILFYENDIHLFDLHQCKVRFLAFHEFSFPDSIHLFLRVDDQSLLIVKPNCKTIKTGLIGREQKSDFFEVIFYSCNCKLLFLSVGTSFKDTCRVLILIPSSLKRPPSLQKIAESPLMKLVHGWWWVDKQRGSDSLKRGCNSRFCSR